MKSSVFFIRFFQYGEFRGEVHSDLQGQGQGGVGKLFHEGILQNMGATTLFLDLDIRVAKHEYK